jgi:hypothetical protein
VSEGTWLFPSTKGSLMDKKQVNEFIGYALLAIFVSYILQMVVPFLMWAVVIMVIWRICLERKNLK